MASMTEEASREIVSGFNFTVLLYSGTLRAESLNTVKVTPSVQKLDNSVLVVLNKLGIDICLFVSDCLTTMEFTSLAAEICSFPHTRLLNSIIF